MRLKLLKNAFLSMRREMLASLTVLFCVTIFFTIALWIAESCHNSEYSIIDAFVWTVVKYVEDPADVTMAPQTIVGQIIGTMVGILGIAIFAVPAGLIGSGLINAMEQEEEEKKTHKNSVSLHKLFRRIPQPSSWFHDKDGYKRTLKSVPVFKSLDQIRVQSGMTEDEIIAAVNNCPDMRLVNLAATLRSEDNPQDRIAVVHYPVNNSYGCLIDRKSDVTIVAPDALTQTGTGNFAFNLAALGGFNYVSHELAPENENPYGFYLQKKARLELYDDDTRKEVEGQVEQFNEDLKVLMNNSATAGRKHWFFFIMGTTKSSDCQMHLWRLATDTKKVLPRLTVNGVEYGSTVTEADNNTLKKILDSLDESMPKRKVSVNLDNNDLLKSVDSSNIMCHIGGGKDCNAVTIRMAYDIIVYSSAQNIIAKELADAIKSSIEPDREIMKDALKFCMQEGNGYEIS